MNAIIPDYKSGYLSELCYDIYDIIYEYIFICFGCNKNLKKELYSIYFDKCKCPGKYMCLTCWNIYPKVICYLCDRRILSDCRIISNYLYSTIKMHEYEEKVNAYKKCLKSYKTIKVLFNSLEQQITYSEDNTADEFLLFVQEIFSGFNRYYVTIDGEKVCGNKLMIEYKIDSSTIAILN